MQKVPFLDLKKQYESIKKEIDEVIFQIISETAFIKGKFVERFENAFSEFININHTVGVGNGTDALAIALKAFNIGKGDEVITAANTFIATSEAITSTGANVKFVDIDPKSYNIDISKIEQKITNKTKAIIPVHLYGQPADMDPIISLAKKQNIKVIEDAAQAHGAQYKNKNIGTIGDLACFSFYPGKNLGAYGDGGAIVTNDDDLAVKIRMISDHGRISKYDHLFEGMNSRLDGLQAGILNIKLKYLQSWNEKRREIAYLYNEQLKDSGLILPYEIINAYCVYHLYVIRIKAEIKNKFQEFLKQNGISTGIHYPIALPFLKAYNYLNHRHDEYPNAYKISQEIVSIPIYPEMSDNQIRYVSDKIKEFLSLNNI